MVVKSTIAMEEWEKITDQEVAKIIDTVPDRVEAVVAADCGPTHV